MRKTALFVDFDNVYLGLRRIDPHAAERFATDPGRWLRWFEAGDDAPGERERRVLVRRCYLNPKSFYSYRPDFVRAAFKVVDCPPLTGQGKTSTDVYLVMDVLDVLAELPHIDEYVVLSADADFTPVLLRLRAHDKQTGVLAVGPAASAYTAAADVVITEETFIEDALGLDADRAAAPVRGDAPDGVLDRIANRLYREASAAGELAAVDVPRVLKEFEEFRAGSNWLGYYGLEQLVRAVVARRADLAVTGGETWAVVVDETAPADRAAADDALADQIMDQIRTAVTTADGPVVMATMAHAVIRELGAVVTESKWAGYGSFRAIVAEVPEVGVVTGPGHPGFLFDPARHEAPVLESPPDRLDEVSPELRDFIQRIHGVTQAPTLTPDEYRAVFYAIAEAVYDTPYHLSDTSRRARDLVLEQGRSVPRTAIGFVLKGLDYRRFPFGDQPSAHDVAVAYRDNVEFLAGNAHMELDERQRTFLDDWLLGPGAAPSSISGEATDTDDEPIGDADDGSMTPDEVAEADGEERSEGVRRRRQTRPPEDL